MLMGHQKILAWASKLKVITVFLTNKEILHDGLTNKNAPIPRLCDGSLYPFLALADPNGNAASSFRLGHNNSFLPSPREIAFKIARKRSNKKEIFPPLPLPNFQPAEFLIDEHGVLGGYTTGEEGDGVYGDGTYTAIFIGRSEGKVFREFGYKKRRGTLSPTINNSTENNRKSPPKRSSFTLK